MSAAGTNILKAEAKEKARKDNQQRQKKGKQKQPTIVEKIEDGLQDLSSDVTDEEAGSYDCIVVRTHREYRH